MAKECLHESCSYDQFGGGYCPKHQYLRQDLKERKEAKKAISLEKKKKQAKKQASKPKPKPPKISQTEKERQAKYRPIAKKFRDEHPECEIQSPVCTFFTQVVHHSRGKLGDLLTDVENFIASCASCNLWVEENHSQAVKMNAIIKRNTGTTRYKNTYFDEKKDIPHNGTAE